MVLPGAPAPLAETHTHTGTDGGAGAGAGARAVVEVAEPDMLRLMRQWHRAEHPGIDEGALAQLDEFHRRSAKLFGERCFGALGDDERPASVAKLRVDDDAAWIEDVYTAPAARRQGRARRVVTAACERARAEGATLVFLVADADDWPQHLYAQIGFRPVGRRWLFHRSDAG